MIYSKTVDDDTKSFFEAFRGAMKMRPEFPTSAYSLHIDTNVGAVWTQIAGTSDNFEPHATLANVGPSDRIIAECFAEANGDVPKILSSLAMASSRQRLPQTRNQGFVSFGPGTQFMKDTVIIPNAASLLSNHGVDVRNLTYDFPTVYRHRDGNFAEVIQTEWDAAGIETKQQCVALSKSIMDYELRVLLPFFINIASKDDKAMLPPTCRFDTRSPLEKMAYHAGISQDISNLMGAFVIGADFAKSWAFWQSESEHRDWNVEIQKLRDVSTALATAACAAQSPLCETRPGILAPRGSALPCQESRRHEEPGEAVQNLS